MVCQWPIGFVSKINISYAKLIINKTGISVSLNNQVNKSIKTTFLFSMCFMRKNYNFFFLWFLAGLAPYSSTKPKVIFSPEIKKKTPEPTHTQTERPRISKVNFDDYFTTWCGIATSKPQNDSKNPCKYL